GAAAWVFIYPILSGEQKAETRRANVARSEPVAAATSGRANQRVRREQIEDTLKELEQRQKKARHPPLSVRLSQSGLSWSKRQYYIFSVCLGLGAFVVPFVVGLDLLPALGF